MGTRKGKGSPSMSVALAAVVVLLAAQLLVEQAAACGSYTPEMQRKVRQVVEDYPGVGPGLIRLFFHDCWVQGCDGSVLLSETPYKSAQGQTERDAAANIGLRGFEVIDAIKGNVTAAFGEGVTCADAVVYGAHAAAVLLSNNKIRYEVGGPGSHRDGLVSSAHNTRVLPRPDSSFDDLVKNYADKDGFDAEDLVTLSGVHAIGRAHLSSFADRFAPAARAEIDSRYRDALEKRVTKGAIAEALALNLSFDPAVENNVGKLHYNPTVEDNVRDMDDNFREQSVYVAHGRRTTSKGVLDNSYFAANLQNMVLFRSDWELTQNEAAKKKLEEYREDADAWYLRFGKAMEKLSKLTNKDKNALYENGPRTKCSVTNYNSKNYYEY